MKFLKKFLDNFGRAFVPKVISPFIHNYLLKGGIDHVPYKIFGMLYYLSIIITTIIFVIFFYPLLIGFSLVKLFLFTFLIWGGTNILITILIILFVYFYLDLRIFKRTMQIEEMFPDFLEHVSSNLKGGLTFDNALWNAINPRYKIISVEVTEVMKRVMTGMSTGEALKKFSNKYNSNMIKRTIDLIVGEIKSGGDISGLLDRMAKDLERSKEMKAEMTASVVGYMIMVSMIVIFVAPLLFALSFHLLSIIIGFLGILQPKSAGPISTPISMAATELSPGDFKIFSLITLISVSLIASFIVAIIEKGEIKGGIKYIPIYVLGSIGSYLVILNFISKLFAFT